MHLTILHIETDRLPLPGRSKYSQHFPGKYLTRMADSFCPLSARTTARQKVRVARRKATIIHSTGKYSKYQDLCNIVQKKCGMTESQVQKELGKFILLYFFFNFQNIPTEEFLKTCPEGLMTKRKFADLSTLALGGKSEFLAEALFRIVTSIPLLK